MNRFAKSFVVILLVVGGLVGMSTEEADAGCFGRYSYRNSCYRPYSYTYSSCYSPCYSSYYTPVYSYDSNCLPYYGGSYGYRNCGYGFGSYYGGYGYGGYGCHYGSGGYGCGYAVPASYGSFCW